MTKFAPGMAHSVWFIKDTVRQIDVLQIGGLTFRQPPVKRAPNTCVRASNGCCGATAAAAAGLMPNLGFLML